MKLHINRTLFLQVRKDSLIIQYTASLVIHILTASAREKETKTC